MKPDSIPNYLVYGNDDRGGRLLVISGGREVAVPALHDWRTDYAVDVAHRRDGWLLLSGSQRHWWIPLDGSSPPESLSREWDCVPAAGNAVNVWTRDSSRSAFVERNVAGRIDRRVANPRADRLDATVPAGLVVRADEQARLQHFVGTEQDVLLPRGQVADASGVLVAVLYRGTELSIVNTANNQIEKIDVGNGFVVTEAAFSPDGTTLAATLWSWDPDGWASPLNSDFATAKNYDPSPLTSKVAFIEARSGTITTIDGPERSQLTGGVWLDNDLIALMSSADGVWLASSHSGQSHVLGGRANPLIALRPGEFELN